MLRVMLDGRLAAVPPRHRVRTLAAVLSLVVALAGCAGAKRDAASSPRTAAIDIGTFNIRNSGARDGDDAWPKRRHLVVELLRERDVWGLQEALPEQVAWLRRQLPEFTVLSRTREVDPERGEACPLLFRTSRWRLDDDDHGTFWLSQQPDRIGSKSWDAALPRIATYARLLERGSGRAFYVYNAHFDHRGTTARLESARLLARHIAARRTSDPVVLLGDLNAGPAAPPLRALVGTPPALLVDAWRAAHPGAAEIGTFTGFRELGDRRIDHVLVTAGLEVVSCEIDVRRPGGRWPSDHVPVVAVLR